MQALILEDSIDTADDDMKDAEDDSSHKFLLDDNSR